MKDVVVIANQVWPVIGGLERVALDEAMLLALEGHSVTYLAGTSRVCDEPETVLGVPGSGSVRILRSRALAADYLSDFNITVTAEEKAASLKRFVTNALDRIKPGLVIGHNMHRRWPAMTEAIFASVAAPDFRAVNRIHTIGRGGDVQSALDAPWIAHLAVSEWVAGQIRSRVPVLTRYAGVNSAFTERGLKHPGFEEIRRENPRARIVFGSFRLDPGKAAEDLIKAIAEVRVTNPDVRLVLCRSELRDVTSNGMEIPKYREQLLELAEEFGIADAVSFIELPSSEMPAAVRSADVIASPSVLEEALCLAGVEAQRSGVPVVATSGGAQGEVISHGAGMLVMPNNSKDLAYGIRRVLDDAVLAAMCVVTGLREVGRKFTYSPGPDVGDLHPKSAARLLPLYTDLANGRNTLSPDLAF